MTKLEAIEQAVKDLPSNELEEFRAWFEEFDAAVFDAKIERDARDGKLDRLAKAALKEFRRTYSRIMRHFAERLVLEGL
jgi:hypothetical protein